MQFLLLKIFSFQLLSKILLVEISLDMNTIFLKSHKKTLLSGLNLNVLNSIREKLTADRFYFCGVNKG